MSKVGFKIKGKEFNLDVKELSLLGKFWGLMFSRRENARALLFDFGKSGFWSIHSLFVFYDFIAIWIGENGKVVGVEKVKPWKFRVVPKKKVVKLIEIPCNKKYSEIVFFLDGVEKSL